MGVETVNVTTYEAKCQLILRKIMVDSKGNPFKNTDGNFTYSRQKVIFPIRVYADNETNAMKKVNAYWEKIFGAEDWTSYVEIIKLNDIDIKSSDVSDWK